MATLSQRHYNLINEPHTKCWRSSGGDTIPLGLTIECDLEIEGKKGEVLMVHDASMWYDLVYARGMSTEY